MNVTKAKFLRRREASTYLKSVWSFDRTPASLAAYVAKGGGPEIVYIGSLPRYTEAGLDAWVKTMIRSTPLNPMGRPSHKIRNARAAT